MEKYGVLEVKADANKTAHDSTGNCPKCRGDIEDTDKTGVLKCKKCGTEPFEKSHVEENL